MAPAGVQVSTNPDTFVRLYTPDAIGLLQDIKNEHLTYMVWKKAPVEINGKIKQKMKVVNVKTTKEDFLALMKEEIVKFKDHVERVKNQYNQFKQLKEILPSNHAMVQMDFAEDYKCQSQDEIQSAYWNATQVTLLCTTKKKTLCSIRALSLFPMSLPITLQLFSLS